MFEDDGTIARGSTSVVHVADQDLLFLHGMQPLKFAILNSDDIQPSRTVRPLFVGM